MTPRIRIATARQVDRTKHLDETNYQHPFGGWATSTSEAPGFASPPFGGFAFIGRSCDAPIELSAHGARF